MRRHVLIDGALRVSLVGAGNRITYSTDHRLIGKLAGAERRSPRCAGWRDLSRVPDVPRDARPRHGEGARLERARSRSGTGTVAVVSIEQDYAPIAAAARESLLPVAAVLELALILLFVLLVPALARASRRLRAYVAEIRYQARHDSLTGLPNRIALHENLADRAARHAPPTSTSRCCSIDLDRFKEVNDSLGHDAGDELLRQIAGSLVDGRRRRAVSRLGGDEFAVVARPTTPAGRDGRWRTRSGRASRRPRSVHGIPVSVDASVGHRARARRRDRGRPAHPPRGRRHVRRQAGARRRAALRRRRPTATTRQARADDRAPRRRRARRARGALPADRPRERPARSRRSRRSCAGATRRRGMLAPGDVHPARRAHAADRRAQPLRAAARRSAQCGAWRSRGVELGVSVNVTVLDLLERSFATDVAHVAARGGVPAVGADDRDHRGGPRPGARPRPAHARGAAGARRAGGDRRLRHGLLVAQLPQGAAGRPDQDRPLVRRRPARVATRAPRSSRPRPSSRTASGFEVVAEGVETEAQFACVADLGVDLVQGYLIAKPVSAATSAR